MLKCGKFIKSSFRLVESWIKMLPDPTDDEQIQDFKNELNASYQLDLEKYLDYYNHGVDDKSLLTETGNDILLKQRSWIEKIQRKLHNASIRNESPGKMFSLIIIYTDLLVRKTSYR